ncbi:NAD(P)-dependent alcohol dehydrogenase [Devosia rhizoryzae]|uniref:NAD(P)-dependent alcohol dehydrogenase n=1 Tax=Devosia rhizoryzae TaxID=2774137 RepID=A0ABX7C3U7_9HYPH|nr:NAD(P)-dependent alcohol dehydrogenase [Devosia rhizoryzae]QQR38417.1 NAD(P)-dependent alcohol dehydrogenase [Devosia rhizoryzae]
MEDTLTVPPISAAMVLEDFGGADKLHMAEVPTPLPAHSGEMLVRVHATSINPIEWKMREGFGLPRFAWRRALGAKPILGLDFAGTVVDARGTSFARGDAVMGALPLHGAYAEYVVVQPADPRTGVARKPAEISFEEAALMPFAGLVAYAGLVTHGRMSASAPGARVLIVGASGGVGHLAVQMARHALGAALVVGVCSSRNAEFAKACGAHEVIAHDTESVADIAERYPQWANSFDLIFDTIGIDTYYSKLARRLLRPDGRFVTAALPQSVDGRPGEDVNLLGGLVMGAKLLWRHATGRYRLITGLLGGLPSHEGVPAMAQWLKAGKLRPHQSASFPLSQIAEAHRLSETGKTVGKISIRIQ